MNIKKVRPVFTKIVTTMDKYDALSMQEDLIENFKDEGAIKEVQRVIAVGDAVKNIKPGDLITFNPMRYATTMHKNGSLKDGIIEDNPVVSFNFATIVLNGEECLVLEHNDVEFVIEEYEEISPNANKLKS